MKSNRKSNGILMRILTTILSLPLLVVSSAVFAQTGPVPQVATVRGMLEDHTGKTPLPAAGVMVTLENQNSTLPAVRSGKDGLYYISNVPAGSYTLKVWTDPKNPLSFPVTVTGTLTDIHPVIVTPTGAVRLKQHTLKPPLATKRKPTTGSHTSQTPAGH